MKSSLVLSWDAIIETLLEDDYLQKHGGNDDGAAAAHLVTVTFPNTKLTSSLICMLTVDVWTVFQRRPSPASACRSGYGNVACMSQIFVDRLEIDPVAGLHHLTQP